MPFIDGSLYPFIRASYFAGWYTLELHAYLELKFPNIVIVKSSEIFSTNSQQKVSPDICDVEFSPVIHMLYNFILHIGNHFMSGVEMLMCSLLLLRSSTPILIHLWNQHFLPLIYCFGNLDVALWREPNTNTDINIIWWHSLYSSVFADSHLNKSTNCSDEKLENLSEETICYTTAFFRVSHLKHKQSF